MKSNEDLQRDVQNALKWEPMLHAAEIGVIVKDGVVTLTGIVNTLLWGIVKSHHAFKDKGEVLLFCRKIISVKTSFTNP